MVLYGIAETLKAGRVDKGYMLKTVLALLQAKLSPGTRAATYAIVDEYKSRRPRLLEDLATVLHHLEAGEIKPVIGRVFPLDPSRRRPTYARGGSRERQGAAYGRSLAELRTGPGDAGFAALQRNGRLRRLSALMTVRRE